MNSKIICTDEDFEKYCEVFDKMTFQAENYVPTLKEIKTVIVPNLPKYMLFLLWIDCTGYETNNNAKIRRLIRQIIHNNLKIINTKGGLA